MHPALLLCGAGRATAAATAAEALAACRWAAAAAACSCSGGGSQAPPPSPWLLSRRGYAAAAAAAHAPAAAAASSSGSGGARVLQPPRPGASRRAVPPELEGLSFPQLKEHIASMTASNPLGEAKLLLLAQKASTPEELEEALRLTRINRARATRLRQYNPYSAYMTNALLQAAKRVGSPAGFHPALLENAHALGVPLSAHAVEAALQACAAADDGGAAFDSAWVLARAHMARPSKHMVFVAARALAARGRPGDAARAVREFQAAGGEVAPSLAKLLAEVEAAAAAEEEEAPQKAAGAEGPAGGAAAAAAEQQQGGAAS
ncbi:hypothetical protein Rsub_12135 [Raphidocelis subcapitata]|uniref:Pentacotripeptide-repeat region of PRORP domain-containing protein n=1 Tax=Raphidocelis subcapitata TaxID=307507 RepID=A0A2V0PPR5_9CHLO|nr:hypothetical protein Rsub_12135 [Raphidocelis subcapitata]|eukprot:GBF99467.1 hypothetical protein Rsub_12135 [Raphidocelis subcapitata]